MRTADELRSKLMAIESEPALLLPPATLDTDPVRAFLQDHLDTQAALLRWALGASPLLLVVDGVRSARRLGRAMTEVEDSNRPGAGIQEDQV
jgi:hypothetical protein